MIRNRKYELLEGDTRVLFDGRVLHRIRTLVDIPAKGVKAGDLGGYLQSERNLSHDGTAWVGDDAEITDEAEVRDHALVDGRARVGVRACVGDDARVGGNAWVSDQACVVGHACVLDHALVDGGAWVCGWARIFGWARVGGDAEVSGQACVGGDAGITGIVRITGHAWIFSSGHVFQMPSAGLESQTLTVMRAKDNGIEVSGFDFEGTLEAFEQKIERCGDDRQAQEYSLLIQLARLRASHWQEARQ